MEPESTQTVDRRVVNLLKELRRLRTEKKVLQRQIAEKVGISKQLYSKIERGERRLTYDMAVKIAGVLGTTPDKIFLKDVSTDGVHDDADETSATSESA